MLPSVVFEPVTAPSMFEETVARLGSAIKVGLLAPGTRLPPERELAEQLGIARSTLRQALTTLVQSGYLVAQRGRAGGTWVTDSPPIGNATGELPADWRDTLDRRVAIEAGAAFLAAERTEPGALDALRERVVEMDAAADFSAYRRADMRFHVGVAEAARSPALVVAMTEVQDALSDLIARIPHPAEVLARANDGHAKIIAALARGDGTRAAVLVRQHSAGTEHILRGLG